MDNLTLILNELYPKKQVLYKSLRTMQPKDMLLTNVDDRYQYVIFVDASVAKGRACNKYFDKTNSVGDIWVGFKDGVIFVTHKDNRDASNERYYQLSNDVVHSFTNDAIKSMAIGNVILEILIPEEEKRKALIKGLEESAKKAIIEKTTKDFSKNLDDRLRQLENTILGQQDTVRNYRASLIHAANQLDQTMKDIAAFNIEVERDKIRQEIINIMSHKKVVNMEMNNGFLCIYTTPLYMFEPKKKERFYLGQMVIKIKTANGNIQFDNLDNRRACYWSGGKSPHPHVSVDGNPCLGNIDAQIADCFTKKQYYMLFLVLLGYLETANIDDCAGKRITSWDKVDKNGNLLSETANTDEDESDDEEEDWDDGTFECEVCHERYDEDDRYYCEDCNIEVCPDCIVEVNGCWYCPTHADEHRED